MKPWCGAKGAYRGRAPSGASQPRPDKDVHAAVRGGLPACLQHMPGRRGYEHRIPLSIKMSCNFHQTRRVDNLYASPNLCDDLLRLCIQSCGNCWVSRKALPRRVSETLEQLVKGELQTWKRGQLGCPAWHSARPILILSTYHWFSHFVVVTHPNSGPSQLKPWAMWTKSTK